MEDFEARFEIEDPPSLRRYLDAHPTVARLPTQVLHAVPRYFPDETSFRLRLLPDRDDGNHVDLFAIIRMALPENEALRRLDQFDEGWWLEAAARARGQLTIDVESAS